MFEEFQHAYPRDPWRSTPDPSAESMSLDPALEAFFQSLGGASFGGGLYRTVHHSQVTQWNDRIAIAFPEFEGRIACFGYDWLGRAFALDAGRLEMGQPGVTMFEPGTGQALQVPANLTSFHASELIEFGEASLAIGFFEDWRKAGGAIPTHDQCIGYQRPLFLGGVDEISNLEPSDLDVYWHLSGQLIIQAKGLPPGTPVTLRID